MKFYQKHIPEGQKIQAVIHQHWLSVMDSFIIWLSFGALLPSFMYYQSERIRSLVPFEYVELLLFLVFLKIVYEVSVISTLRSYPPCCSSSNALGTRKETAVLALTEFMMSSFRFSRDSLLDCTGPCSTRRFCD